MLQFVVDGTRCTRCGQCVRDCVAKIIVWCGLAKWAMEAVPSLKEAAGIPPDSSYYVMLFGLPAVRYPRTVQRDSAERIRRISV